MPTAHIAAVEGHVPPFRLTNTLLEEMVDTTDEWIRTRTGIEERRIQNEPGLATSDLAVPAVERLLASSDVGADDIDLVICATVTPDMVFPATANIISDKAGIRHAFSFDINAACSGFIYALETGRRFIEAGQYHNVLVIGADKMSSIIDYTDRNTCVLFGDGAGVVLLQPGEDDLGILDARLYTDGSGVRYLHQKAGGSLKPPSHATVDAREHFVFQDGRPVFKHAVVGMADVTEEVMRRNGLTGDDLDWLVPHQANLRIIDATRRRAGLDEEKVMINIQRYGNTTAATIPLCLWEWRDRIRRGDRLILTTFGGGFTWGAMYLRWSL